MTDSEGNIQSTDEWLRSFVPSGDSSSDFVQADIDRRAARKLHSLHGKTVEVSGNGTFYWKHVLSSMGLAWNAQKRVWCGVVEDQSGDLSYRIRAGNPERGSRRHRKDLSVSVVILNY